MRFELFGKFYGWCPIFIIDLHLNTGTVMRHRFYRWRQRAGEFKWNTPDSMNFKSVDTISGWNVVDVKYKFFFGADTSLWISKD